MSAARVRIGLDNFGCVISAEMKDNGWLLLTTDYGAQIYLPPEAWPALVQYVERAKVAA